MSTKKRLNKSAKLPGSSRDSIVGQLVPQQPQSSTQSRLTRPSAVQDLHRIAIGGQISSHQRNFGTPSNSGLSTKSQHAGSSWTGLVQKTVTNSASQILGGGLLGSGLSSIFSSIFHLFGHGSQSHPPALERFSLPQMEQKTIDTAQGLPTTIQTGFSNGQASTVPLTQVTTHPGAIEQAAVVKAVKNALLTSSSLNDIIGEL